LASRQSTAHIPELDGIRGLAIALVIYWHYVAMPWARSDGGLGWLLSRAGMYAWSGVDLFFVLSGFLIGGILIDVRESPSYFRTFYVRRAFRILPIYLAVWLAGALAVAVSPALTPVLGPPMPWWTYATFTQNIWLFRHSWDVYLAATWSLAVEEQFYLTLPLVVRLVHPARLPATVALLALASLAARAVVYFTAGGGGHVLMPCRADALMLGVLGAIVVREPRLREALSATRAPLLLPLVVSGAGIAAAFWRGWTRSPAMATVGYSLIAIFYLSLLLLAVCRPQGAWAALLRLPPLRRLGQLAYCLYLTNEPVLALTRYVLRGGRRPEGPDWPAVAIAFVVSLALCEASWRWFESRMVAAGHRVSYARR